MSAILRRAGSKLGKLIARAADPAVVAGRAQIYAKTVSGVAQFFAMAGDGTVTQLSSPSVAPPVYPRYPIPTFTTSTSSFKTLINTEAYANYFGKAGQAITQVTVRFHQPRRPDARRRLHRRRGARSAYARLDTPGGGVD